MAAARGRHGFPIAAEAAELGPAGAAALADATAAVEKELFRYTTIPGELAVLGVKVRERVDKFYATLGDDSIDRRILLDLKLKKMGNVKSVKYLEEKIKRDQEELSNDMIEMERLAKKPIIVLRPYLKQLPDLLPAVPKSKKKKT